MSGTPFELTHVWSTTLALSSTIRLWKVALRGSTAMSCNCWTHSCTMAPTENMSVWCLKSWESTCWRSLRDMSTKGSHSLYVGRSRSKYWSGWTTYTGSVGSYTLTWSLKMYWCSWLRLKSIRFWVRGRLIWGQRGLLRLLMQLLLHSLPRRRSIRRRSDRILRFQRPRWIQSQRRSAREQKREKNNEKGRKIRKIKKYRIKLEIRTQTKQHEMLKISNPNRTTLKESKKTKFKESSKTIPNNKRRKRKKRTKRRRNKNRKLKTSKRHKSKRN